MGGPTGFVVFASRFWGWLVKARQIDHALGTERWKLKLVGGIAACAGTRMRDIIRYASESCSTPVTLLPQVLIKALPFVHM